MRNKFLLGATVNNELVFGEFELKHPSYYSKEKGGYTDKEVLEFSASFNTVMPFKAEDYDLEGYYEGWIDGMDKEYLYDLCERFDCRPSELPKSLADECYDVRDALDCSLYPEEIIVDGESWCFESCSFGQHDTRKDGMEEYTDLEAYNLLHKLWDNYHLKKVDESIIKQVEKLIDMLSKINEEEWIVDYIERHKCDL